MFMSPAGLGPENERPAGIVNDRPILSSERMLHKDYDRREITVRESQGVYRQDELTGGWPPLV
jgi:hypothetical protein